MKIRLHYAEMDTWIVEMRLDGELVFCSDKDFSSLREFLQFVQLKQPPTIAIVSPDVEWVNGLTLDNIDFVTYLRMIMTRALGESRENAKVTVDPLKEK